MEVWFANCPPIGGAIVAQFAVRAGKLRWEWAGVEDCTRMEGGGQKGERTNGRETEWWGSGSREWGSS